jgi:hypothetical protein
MAEFVLDDGEGERSSRNRGSTSHQLSGTMMPVGILKTSAVHQANHVYFDCSSSFF